MAHCSRRREVDPLVHIHFLIMRSQKARLRELSARDDLSMANFVREAIDLYLRVAAGPAANQLRHQMLESVGSLPVVADGEAADGKADGAEPRGYW